MCKNASRKGYCVRGVSHASSVLEALPLLHNLPLLEGNESARIKGQVSNRLMQVVENRAQLPEFGFAVSKKCSPALKDTCNISDLGTPKICSKVNLS